MPSVLDVTNDYTARLRAREARALRRMIADWEAVIADLTARATKLGEMIEQATLTGTPVSPDWVFRQERTEEMLRQAQQQLALLTDRHVPYLGEQMGGAALDGAKLAVAQVRAGTLGAKLSTEAVQAIAAATQAGPVAELLGSLDVTGAMRRALINGIARGANPRTVAREITRALQVERNRALTIARTEMARAQRNATLATYRAAGVTTWVWRSARSARTCAACWAMDGEEFETRDALMDHPNGRCAMVPGGTEFGSSPSRDAAWARLSESDKARVLGPTRYKLVSSGQRGIADMGHVTSSGRWGTSVRVKPLSVV